MSRPRKNSIPITVEVDGVEIPASLRRQRGRAGNWEIRWKMHGVPDERSTGTPVFEEAKQIARQIIHGEPKSVVPEASKRGMNISEFEQIQREYHARNALLEAGKSTLQEFIGVWRSFLRVCPVKTVQAVTEQVALQYLRCLKNMSRTENRKCKKKSPTKLSVKTIQKHIRTLAGAWNLIREGHSQRVGGLHQHQLVQSNPWQAIRNNVPQSLEEDDSDPVQFELADNDLGRFLDQFQNHPVGELFIITSLWCWGRITEMTAMEWSWIRGDYVVIPKSKAKGARGKTVRLPPTVLERLNAIRDPHSAYVFARWVEDVRSNSGRPTRVQPFDPSRMRGQMEKLIPTLAEAIGRPEISHHALRRTAMELGEEAELRFAEMTSAEKLQTTVGNKRKHYTKRRGRKAFDFADGLYRNLTLALHDFPAIAKRVGCEPLEMLVEQEAEKHLRMLSPLGRQRVVKKVSEDAAEDDSHSVA
jgi:hypothetical protein